MIREFKMGADTFKAINSQEMGSLLGLIRGPIFCQQMRHHLRFFRYSISLFWVFQHFGFHCVYNLLIFRLFLRQSG